MNPRWKLFFQILFLIGIVIGLILIFPSAFGFAEMAARELRYFWWLILLVLLAGWLIWGFKKRS